VSAVLGGNDFVEIPRQSSIEEKIEPQHPQGESAYFCVFVGAVLEDTFSVFRVCLECNEVTKCTRHTCTVHIFYGKHRVRSHSYY